MSEYEIVLSLLLPHCNTADERITLVTRAFQDSPQLIAKITYEGSSVEFVMRLVRMLQGHGEVSTGIQAFWQLLLTLREQVGLDQRQRIDDLEPWANQSHQVDPLLPSGHQTIIHGDVSGANVLINSTQTVHGNLNIYQGVSSQLVPPAQPARQTRRVFLSYARADDEPFVKRLYHDLKQQGFEVWWDRVSMPSRALTFLQEIRDAITQVDRVLFVVGPRGIKSDYVRAEWEYALSICHTVTPLLRLGDYTLLPSELAPLHTVDFRRTGLPFFDTRYATAFKDLLRILREPEYELGPVRADPLPARFVPRLEELAAIRDAVLSDVNRPTVITSAKQTTALQGMGGVGKTLLARAFCWDCDTRHAFPDGVYWLTLGQTPDLLRVLGQLGTLLGDSPLYYSEINTATQRLREVFADRAALIVVDDVWHPEHMQPLLIGGQRCRLLITTRQRTVVNAMGATECQVGVLAQDKAMTLLAEWAGQISEVDYATAVAVAEQCGYLPLALSITGAMLRDNRTTWMQTLVTLKQAALGFLENEQGNIAASIKASLDVLAQQHGATAVEHYEALAVFPEDVAIPGTTIMALWRGRGLSDTAAQRLLGELASRALLFADEQAGGYRLHDLQRDYITMRLIERSQTRVALHQALLAGWGDFHTLPDEYAWRNLAYHLREAGQVGMLPALLLDFHFLQAKLNATDANAVLADFVGLTDKKALRLLESAISMSAHVINQDTTQLALQLYGRLLGYQETQPKLASLLQTTSQQQGSLHLLHATLSQAGGALIRTIPLEYGAKSIALTNDGQHLVVADGRQVKVFIWHHDALLTNFTQHTDVVNGVSVQGEIAFSASADRTVKVWRWATGELVTNFTQHTDVVNGVSVQGEIAFSASADWTVKVWRWATGELVTNFNRYACSANAVSVQGELAFSADNHGVKVWRWDTGKLITSFEHLGHVNAVSVQGELAFSAAQYGEVKVWRWDTGELITTFTRHSGNVNAVSVQGELAFSAADDMIVKVWYWATGKRFNVFKQHTDRVTAVIVQGELAFSASADRTVKVWRWATDKRLTTLRQHTDSVTAVSIHGELAFSTTKYGRANVWYWATGKMLTEHEPYLNEGDLQGELVFSAVKDETLKVWHAVVWRWTIDKPLIIFTEHTSFLNGWSMHGDVAFFRSEDGTVKVWRWRSGELLNTFTGHTHIVMGVSIQGKLAFSASYDRTVKVWHWATGEVVTTFTADEQLTCIAFEPDQRILLAGDIVGHVHVLHIVGLDHLL
jgi:WD40 repeat protein